MVWWKAVSNTATCMRHRTQPAMWIGIECRGARGEGMGGYEDGGREGGDRVRWLRQLPWEAPPLFAQLPASALPALPRLHCSAQLSPHSRGARRGRWPGRRLCPAGWAGYAAAPGQRPARSSTEPRRCSRGSRRRGCGRCGGVWRRQCVFVWVGERTLFTRSQQIEVSCHEQQAAQQTGGPKN